MRKYFYLSLAAILSGVVLQSCDQTIEDDFAMEFDKEANIISIQDVKLIADRGVEVKYEIANPYSEDFCYPKDLNANKVSSKMGIHITNISDSYDQVGNQGLLISETGFSRLSTEATVELTNVRYKYPLKYQFLNNRKIRIYFDGRLCKDANVTRHYSEWYNVSPSTVH